MMKAPAILLLFASWWLPGTVDSATPSDAERYEIEMLVGAYYRAAAAEDLDEVVELHHWDNSFERDKITALVDQAFTIADTSYERVRISSIDLFADRGTGLVRVGIEYVVRSYDGADAFSGHQEVAIVVVNRGKGWRIGTVRRAADLDLGLAASQLGELSQELEETVPAAPLGDTESPPKTSKLPKLAEAPASAGPPPHSAAPTAVTASAPATGGLTFFALRRKATGACEVVAGAEGISPGDTVLGAFSDFGAAHATTEEKCGRVPSAVSTGTPPVGGSGPLTTERLFKPDDTVTRGSWGTVTRISDEAGFANANDAGQPLGDGYFVHPGNGGPTEIVYLHDGSSITLRGRATVIDCVAHCGRGGTVTFGILGDGKELWNSGLVRHEGPGQAFVVHLGGVSELRLIASDGGNGNGEDWAAWLDLEVGEEAEQPPAPTDASVSGGPSGSPGILAIPRYRADESTAGAWVVDLNDGSAAFIDRVGIGGDAYRRRELNLNVFTVLGRPNDKPARPGEILAGEIRSTSGAVTALFLVETSTGAAAYLANLEREPNRATYRPVNGRPAAAIASDDGNFALVMRRDGAGGTDGAYLYHATSGRCVYFAHVDEMQPDPVVRFTSPLPKMQGPAAALPLQAASEATPQALLVDQATGAVYTVHDMEREPIRLAVKRQPLGLFEFFPESPSVDSSSRFVLIPGFSNNGAADSVFVIDAGTGNMAVLKDVRTGGPMRIVGSTKSLTGHLPATRETGRALAAVPKVGDSGTTDGAWIFDPALEGVLVLEHVRDPQNLKIRRIGGGSHEVYRTPRDAGNRSGRAPG